jgi:hypothetical protein
MGEWRPVILHDRNSDRSVHITIFERELYKSGFFSFEDLYQIYEAVDNPDYDENADGGENVHQTPVD